MANCFRDICVAKFRSLQKRLFVANLSELIKDSAAGIDPENQRFRDETDDPKHCQCFQSLELESSIFFRGTRTGPATEML